ncbi:phage tail protein [uncultured Parasutterella sp.]|uniref:phage tail protein n=2 Tax=uncultured Parasutterella sp. TaxID=1263098 RepID=UPI0026030878|nr:phage tail protein [uncultured Parasutterella sp.]
MTATTYATKWTANAIETPPDLAALVSSGYPTNGDPSKGIPPTLPGAPWFHWVAQSLATVIVGNGLTLDQTKTDQLLGALKNFGKTVVPIGSVIFYLGTTIPDGYLLCNGASLSRTEYQELFEVLGTKCGAVDSAHFNLPDTHHRFLEGTTSVSEVGRYIAAGLPNSSGVLRVIDGTYGIFSPESSGVFKVAPGTNKINVTVTSGYQGDNHANFDLSKGNSLYGSSDTVQPCGLFAMSLIRAYQ